MKLSQKYADFTVEVNVSVPYIQGKLSALQLDSATGTAAGNYLTDWNTKDGIYINIGTHTTQSVLDMGIAYHIFHPYMEGIKQQLKNNKNLTLTGEDIAKIHIHQDAPHRTKVPRPVISPVNKDIAHKHLVVTIFSSNPNPPHESETNMPTDIAKIGRKLAVVPANSGIPNPAQYHNLEDIGSTIYNLVFSPEQGGAVGYLITWYVSPTGETGPQSDPLVFQILGLPVQP